MFVELVLADLDIGVGVDLVALDDVVVGDLLAGVGIDLRVFDAMAGLAVDLVEGDLLGIRGGRIQRDRAGHERQPQKTLPIGAGGHGKLRYATGDESWRITPRGAEFKQPARGFCNGVNRPRPQGCLAEDTGGAGGGPVKVHYSREHRPYRALPPMLRAARARGLQRTRSPWRRQSDDRIVETPTEARQAEPGPSVLALLSASTGLAILILAVVWFVFFRT